MSAASLHRLAITDGRARARLIGGDPCTPSCLIGGDPCTPSCLIGGDPCTPPRLIGGDRSPSREALRRAAEAGAKAAAPRLVRVARGAPSPHAAHGARWARAILRGARAWARRASHGGRAPNSR